MILESTSKETEVIEKNVAKNKEELEKKEQLSLFGMIDEKESSIVKSLAELNLLNMTPLEALNVLHKLQQQLE